MCGLLGMFSLGGSRVDHYDMRTGLRAIEHRGPDALNDWYNTEMTVGLGHTRLSIIDLASGDQPLHCNERDLHCIVNGEFYDYEAIREELQEQGFCFSTRSDSEILLNLYYREGVSGLDHLRGEFAFCLYDGQNRRLFAARDRFGIKPLYYTVHNNTLLLASEIKALKAAGVPIEFDEGSVIDQSFYCSSRGTFYKNIHEIPPGHFLLASNGSFDINPYWNLSYPDKGMELDCTDEKLVIADIRSSMLESVEHRLRSDVDVGVYLSGGIDSCALLGMASYLSKKPIDSFSLCFMDDESFNEQPIAREMADNVGSKLQEIPVYHDEIADYFESAVWHAEKPFPNANALAKYYLSRKVRDAGYKVVLTGEGADEVFAGYLPFHFDALSEQEDAEDLEVLRRQNPVSFSLMMGERRGKKNPVAQRLLGFTPAWYGAFDKQVNLYRRLCCDDVIQRYANMDSFFNFMNDYDLRGIRGSSSLHKSLYLWSKAVLPKYILNFLADRMEMAHSLEGRVPFLDHHLVDKVTRLPAHMKIRNGVEKYVLREAVKPFVTETVYGRRKHPFSSPPTLHNKESRLFQLMGDLIHSDDCKSLPFFDHKKVLAYFEEARSSDASKAMLYDAGLLEVAGLAVVNRRLIT